MHTSWESAHTVAARGSSPPRFSSQTLLSLSPRFMTEGGDARHEHDGVVQGAPSHHRAQGASFNPFGGHPPLSDVKPPCGDKREGEIPPVYPQYDPQNRPQMTQDRYQTTSTRCADHPRPVLATEKRSPKMAPKYHKKHVKMIPG